MADRSAWLALTREEVIEQELLICDPHHHLWDHPSSRYLVDELLLDIGGGISGGHHVVNTVFVECLQFYRPAGPIELRPVGETEFIDGVAGVYATQSGQTNVASGIVGFADLALGADIQPVLEAHMAASSRFRGVRHASAWDSSDRIHNAYTKPPRDLLQNAEFRRGIACLGRLGLSFDAWLYHPQIPQLTDLAEAFPDLTIVLDHMAGPVGIGPYADQRDEVFDVWRESLAGLARCDNVFVKLGGRTMSMAGFGWHNQAKPPGSIELAETIGPYYRTCIELFGAGRCMFESNFPVDRAACSYTVLWNAYKRLSKDYSSAERAALFQGTASRVYRLAKD